MLIFNSKWYGQETTGDMIMQADINAESMIRATFDRDISKYVCSITYSRFRCPSSWFSHIVPLVVCATLTLFYMAVLLEVELDLS